MKNQMFGLAVGLLLASVLVGITTVTEEVQEKQGQSYEFCRDKLFTTYPEEVDREAWRKCING